eukprot:m.372783 g.372783  ORF g.372783 m.372783 type:complete len:99 (-) comp19995_c15_seq2:1120-1416(-)
MVRGGVFGTAAIAVVVVVVVAACATASVAPTSSLVPFVGDASITVDGYLDDWGGIKRFPWVIYWAVVCVFVWWFICRSFHTQTPQSTMQSSVLHVIAL